MSLWIGFQNEEGDDVFRWMTGDVVGGNNYSNWASTGTGYAAYTIVVSSRLKI